MRKYFIMALALTLTLSLTACGDKKGAEANGGPNPISGSNQQMTLTPEGAAWRESITKSPTVAEVENSGTKYEIHVDESKKYIFNTATNELITGTSTGDAKDTVLKDWVDPFEQTMLNPKEAVFKDTWEYTSARARGLIGYCDANYTLVTRARTTDYVEYIYQDKNTKMMYRIAVTNDYILYAPLAFAYVFDVNAY